MRGEGVAAVGVSEGPCELSTGWEAEFRTHKPTVRLCGRPGVARRGMMWCEVYACDDCYARWLGKGEREGQ